MRLQKEVGMKDNLFLYTIDETAKILRIGKTRLYQEINCRNIVPIKMGKKTFFRRMEIERYINSLPAFEPLEVTNIIKDWREEDVYN
jgi:hypothetical protein